MQRHENDRISQISNMQSYLQRLHMREHVRQQHRNKQDLFSKNDYTLATRTETIKVRWEDGDDNHNPRHWSWWSKVGYTTCVGPTGLLTSGASASNSEVVPRAVQQYAPGHPDSAGTIDMHGTQIELMATSLYLCAFDLGPIVSAPFSETFGRNTVCIVSLGFLLALAPLYWIYACTRDRHSKAPCGRKSGRYSP